jgi:hypothetical protein
MNQRLLLAGLMATVCLLGSSTNRAWAQAGPYVTPGGGYGNSPYGYGTPRLSPYLNLLRGGNTAANYFMGVVPEVERRANAALYGSQIQELARRTEGAAEAQDLFPRLTETGHPAVFANYGTYFGSNLQRPLQGGAAGLNRPGQPGGRPAPR